ncbi:MAG TPA: DUF1641 domain-containing protein [Paenalcaligenes sp.]|nr:DUF1641 domain-containing protein [Paenalcaligenes sp.]
MTQSNDNYLSIDEGKALPKDIDALIQDDATLAGLQELIDKLEPLIAGGRLHRLVDIASIAADLVDMSDKYMVEKLAKAGEELVGGTWAVGNAARMASTQLRDMEQTPSLIGLLRLAREPDVRRGLTFLLLFASVIGKTHRYQDLDYTTE